MKYGFGVDLGGTTVKLAYFDQEGTLLHKWEIPTDISEKGKNILADIARAIRGFLDEKNIPDSDILGIGIGVPGPVNRKGVVHGCVNLGWGIFNLEETLAALTGFTVSGGNDATVAALGECWKGGGKGYKNLLLVTLGTGVGGGIVIDGNILYGTHGSAGEIGHIVLDRNETEQGTCGNYGDTEHYCSATGIVRLAKRYFAAHETDSPLAAMEQFTAKDVIDADKAGDPAAHAIMQNVYSYLGQVIANTCTILDPEVVVLGGGVSKAGTCLIDGLLPYFMKDAFPAVKDVQFRLAELGNDAGAYGAFKLVLQRLEK